MSRVFDILFVLGIVANLLNLGDFLLRPSQKESFQRHIETAVLWLDYTRPMAWVRRLGNMPAYWLFPIGLFTGYVGWSLMNSIWATNFGRMLGYFMFISSFFIVVLAHRWRYANVIFNYVTSDGKVSTFLWRSIGLSTLSFSISVAAAYGFYLIEKSGNLWLNLISLGYLAICLYFARSILTLSISIPAIVFMVYIMFLLFIMESILIFTRAICWRIVEFSKGAWAAVILLATVAIGLSKLLLSSS
jgi:hypothetical protein